MFNPINLIPPQFKMYAFAAILVASFVSGFYVRGYIAVAEINAAKIKGFEEATKIAKDNYEKELKSLKADSERRWKSKNANMGVYSATGDACSDSPILPQWMRLIQDAYGNRASK